MEQTMAIDSQSLRASVDSEWLTPHELVDRLPWLSLDLLSQWRKSGDGPIFHKFGKQVLYCLDEVNDWVKVGTARRSTADTALRRR